MARVGSYGGGNFSLDELTSDEVDLLTRASLGLSWVRMADGKIEALPVHKIVVPTDDPELQHFYSDPLAVQLKLKFGAASFREQKHDALFVESICGYAGNAAYRGRAETLESIGAIRMRSVRDPDGRYWELWYLPQFRATGACKGKTIPQIRDWIFQHVNPGVVMTLAEHWGLSYD